MKTKKVKLFLVEGPSEETALALIFERLFSNDAVKFDVVHGDVTVNLNGKTVRNAVREQVIRHVRTQNYSWKDLAEIIHIVDIDGAFIPDDKVVKASEVSAINYGESCIEAPNPGCIVCRNHEKAAALKQLSSISEITYERRGVPYGVYFLSRNMEHALHGEVCNISNEQKERLARKFQREYKNNLNGFVTFMREEIGIDGDYSETWRYLQEGVNSLRRGSNLHLFLPYSEYDSK
jgi:hypothetical protein